MSHRREFSPKSRKFWCVAVRREEGTGLGRHNSRCLLEGFFLEPFQGLKSSQPVIPVSGESPSV